MPSPLYSIPSQNLTSSSMKFWRLMLPPPLQLPLSWWKLWEWQSQDLIVVPGREGNFGGNCKFHKGPLSPKSTTGFPWAPTCTNTLHGMQQWYSSGKVCHLLSKLTRNQTHHYCLKSRCTNKFWKLRLSFKRVISTLFHCLVI